ncbi:MAG: hypothetical protein KGQ52_03250 [Alphaproteobacteria bacterium]|nr:hypothetical protein [Alphaproteobacteria bacterium]
MTMNQAPTALLRQQHNGWTPERQQRFLAHLEVHGSVAAAARHVGLSRQSAYWLRRQPVGAAFGAAWDAALADRDRLIDDMAMDRLIDGEEEVILRDGEVIAVRRRPADVRLLLFQLKRVEERKIVELQRQNPVDSTIVSKLRAELRAIMAAPHDQEDDILAPDWPAAPFTFAGE